MSHIFSITLRWARPGSCAGDHRYQKVLTTVRSAVSREIHAPRRKEVNWRKTITISYILSWCLGRVDISIVMIYLDILLIILDTVNNNHIIPINTIYIYTYIRVCVCLCVYPSLSLFSGRWNAPSLTQEGTSRLGPAATGLTAIDGGRLAHGKLHDVAHEGCLDSLCETEMSLWLIVWDHSPELEHLGWPSSTKQVQPVQPKFATTNDYQHHPILLEGSWILEASWSQGAGRANSTAACTIQAMKGVWDTYRKLPLKPQVGVTSV